MKVGDLLTLGSVVVGLAGFLYAWAKDRRLCNREYADRIRLAAAQTLAGIERWKEVGLRAFDDAQPLLTDADTDLVKEQDPIQARDSLWRALMALQADTSKRILGEKLEGAYSGLYGYDPDVHNVYRTAVHELRVTLDLAFSALLNKTQSDVLAMTSAQKPYTSANLGNRLRRTTNDVVKAFEADAEKAVAPVRERMLSIVVSGDKDIVRKLIKPAKGAN